MTVTKTIVDVEKISLHGLFSSGDELFEYVSDSKIKMLSLPIPRQSIGVERSAVSLSKWHGRPAVNSTRKMRVPIKLNQYPKVLTCDSPCHIVIGTNELAPARKN